MYCVHTQIAWYLFNSESDQVDGSKSSSADQMEFSLAKCKSQSNECAMLLLIKSHDIDEITNFLLLDFDLRLSVVWNIDAVV